MPTSYQMFVKKHMSSMSGSPKEKMAKIGKMWRETKGGVLSGAGITDNMGSDVEGAGMLGDFFKKAGKSALNLAKSEGTKLVKSQVEKFKKDPIGYAKSAYALGKTAVGKVKGGELPPKRRRRRTGGDLTPLERIASNSKVSGGKVIMSGAGMSGGEAIMSGAGIDEPCHHEMRNAVGY